MMVRTPALWVASAILLAGCPKQGAQTSGDQVADNAVAETDAATTSSTGSGEATERQVGPDGRLQQLDAYGNPMFDASGAPIWEPTAQERAQQAFEEALALSSGVGGASPDIEGAIRKLDEAVALLPAFKEAWFNLGLLRLEKSELAQARVALEKASALDPEAVPVWQSLGIAYERSGELGQAEVAYARGLQYEPENVSLLNGQARLLRKRGEYQAAVSKARAILKVNSNSLDAYNTLGLAYLELGQLELAKFVFMKAAADVPGGDVSASIAANMGLVYFREGEEFAAEERFRKARELDPAHTGAAVNLAYIRLKNLDFEGAHELLEQAYKALPGSLPIQLNLAVARRGVGDFQGAQQLLDGIIGGGGEFADEALLNLAILQGDFLKDYSASMATYNEYVAVKERAGTPLSEDSDIFEYLRQVEKLQRREDKRRQRELEKRSEPEPDPVDEEEPMEDEEPLDENPDDEDGDDSSEPAPDDVGGADDGNPTP